MPLSTEELRKRIGSQQWTAHNIRLNSECTTRPGEPDFHETDLRLHAILRVMDMLFGPRLEQVRVADLGCLEGGFALALAQRGAQVLGIEARRRNIEKAELLRDHFGLPNLSFQLSDVKDFKADRFGQFDLVLALGILYHLDQPVEWLRQISATTRRALILDTHFAPADDLSMSSLDSRLTLGPLERRTSGGSTVEGRWFHEFPEGADPEAQLWASYSNHKSFWLTKESLVRSVAQAGFPLVFEQHDYSCNNYGLFNVTYPRCILVAIREAS